MSTNYKKIIGVVGGMGPYAGIDLVQKIFNQTNAKCDQDHLPVLMFSAPQIPDRTEFLLRKSNVNPAIAISDVISTLYKQGASVIGMPCNTAHTASIFNEIINRVPNEVELIHMISEVAKYIKKQYPSVVKVGILSTTGTYLSNVYPTYLSQHGLVGVQVLEDMQKDHIHSAIYSKSYGIKACSTPVTARAKEDLHIGIEYLISERVGAIVLGCTEIPLALTEKEIKGIPIIDATKVLARALVLSISPEKIL